MPVLLRVRNKCLLLRGYQLNSGLCESLNKSFEIYPELLDSINLTNNGITDGDLAKVLNGLTKLKTIKSIIVKNNVFLTESCNEMEEIL